MLVGALRCSAMSQRARTSQDGPFTVQYEIQQEGKEIGEDDGRMRKRTKRECSEKIEEKKLPSVKWILPAIPVLVRKHEEKYVCSVFLTTVHACVFCLFVYATEIWLQECF